MKPTTVRFRLCCECTSCWWKELCDLGLDTSLCFQLCFSAVACYIGSRSSGSVMTHNWRWGKHVDWDQTICAGLSLEDRSFLCTCTLPLPCLKPRHEAGSPSHLAMKQAPSQREPVLFICQKHWYSVIYFAALGFWVDVICAHDFIHIGVMYLDSSRKWQISDAWDRPRRWITLFTV